MGSKVKNMVLCAFEVTAKLVVVAVVLICTISMGYVVGKGAIIAYKMETIQPVDTVVLPITEKELSTNITRFGVIYSPRLKFQYGDEDLVLVVNTDSFNNISEGDYIALDIWIIFDEYHVRLNKELNNFVKWEE